MFFFYPCLKLMCYYKIVVCRLNWCMIITNLCGYYCKCEMNHTMIDV